MGQCFSTQSVYDANFEHTSISSQQKNPNSIKILLLGTLGCGKSTIIKQLQKLNNAQQNFSTAHISSYIKDTVVADMKTLCEYPHTSLHRSREYLREEIVTLSSPYKLTHNIAYKVKELYKDTGIRATLKKRDNFKLSISDNIEHFFNKIDEIVLDSYEPTFEDVVKFYSPTIGYSAATFVKRVDNFGEYMFEIADIGGARSERRKFLQTKLVLDPDLNTIIFVVAISEYNMVAYEDNTTNRLVESINVLKQILDLINVEAEFYENKSFILLFNKYDLFQQKIKQVPITVAFEDFPANMLPNDPDHVLRFIAGKFLTVFKQCKVELKKPLRIIRTTAVDSESIEQMFDKIGPGIVVSSGMAHKNLILKRNGSNKASNKILMDAAFAAPLILQKQFSEPTQQQHLSPLTLPLKTHSLPTFGNAGKNIEKKKISSDI